MSKVTMPDRVAKIGNTFQLLWFGARTITEIAEQTGAKVGDALITTTQAEAYADARVREALEEAAKICWEMQSAPEFGKDDKDRWLAIAESRIRSMIKE